ncbi:uncharacterized protein LOC127833629 isoform X2 [Dreissena polymorpha]|uniref:uncharacterized protein LOC127833629 isoform X2 n=1 Tax=Dreissena polymorpha TaxID=45954 RepID=UPI002264762B|nr:uncharacterized protein LOC127833629 isoform X2 [Dreissena polymorpha]
MASLADVFTEKESTNWLKAWLAVDIAKSGLDHFAENEAKTLHLNIYNAVWSSVMAPAVCFGCNTANLLNCPTRGVCDKQGANSSCKAMHDTVTNQPRPCPTNVCNKVLDEIKNLHRFARPSWKNTRADLWAQHPWQIAKAYFPPDGYTAKNSVQETDFNGIISFMMNCKHFDNKFSFPICSGQSNPPCLLTKAREIGRTVRHLSQCKLTDADLQVIFTTLTDLLTDPTCLAHIVASQEAVNKLVKLQHDVLKITTEEIIHLLEAVQDKLKKVVQDELKEVFQDKDKEVIQDKVKEVENIAEKTLQEIRESIQRYMNDLKEHNDTCKQQLDEHTKTCEVKLDEHTGKCEVKLDEHTGKCKVKLDEHSQKCEVKLDEHTEKCEMKLDEHTEQLKNTLDGHSRKQSESNYAKSCEDFLRRLIKHYKDTSSYVPLSPLDQSLDKCITDIYATPKIHRINIKKDGTRKKAEQVSLYNEILYTNDLANRHIYVQGDPGSGKSTFAAKLVHDWCNKPLMTAPDENTAFDDLMTIEKFKFIFFISLRDVIGQKDIRQMIRAQLVDRMYSEDDLNDVHKLLKKIIETEQCLVVQDGLDEWIAPDGCNLPEPSLTGLQQDTVTVLTTARPWKLADERIKNSQIDILLEIEGIRDPDMFCKKILGCIIDETEDLDKTVKEFQTFVEIRELESLSASPMLYTLVICMWVDTTKEEEQLTGYSLCALYTIWLETLCKKANSTTGYFNDLNPSPVECFSRTSYLQPNIVHLDKLAAAACKLLFSSERETSIVFSNITLSNYFSQEEFTFCLSFALKAGILTNRKDKSRTSNSNSFIHKTLQEFLAAYYIARNTHVIQDVIVGYLNRYCNSYLDISQVFVFLCGINTVAANELSGLMNECNVAHGYDPFETQFGPSEFQMIIEEGIKEAAASKQDGICPTLSQFYIYYNNIQDLHRIWSTNTANVRSLYLGIYATDIQSLPLGSSLARGQQKSHFEFNLSSCHRLKDLRLEGSAIWLKDPASLGTSDLPVWIFLNNAEPSQCGDPPSVLPSIAYIKLSFFKCSSSGLRSLFSTLLTLDHEVKCTLEDCVITSSVGRSSICTKATIRTGLNKTFHIGNVMSGPGFWEALHGLNIKCLDINGLNADCIEHGSESLLKSLKSLIQLDTLSISAKEFHPTLMKTLYILNIKTVTLSLIGRCPSRLIRKYASRISQEPTSPTQMDTLYIAMNSNTGLLDALYDLIETTLSLCGNGENVTVNRVSAECKSLETLKQPDPASLGTSDTSVLIVLNNAEWGNPSKVLPSIAYIKLSFFKCYSSGLRSLFRTLLTLDHEVKCTLEDCVITSSVGRSSICTKATIRTGLNKTFHIGNVMIGPGFWEALHGLNIKCLDINGLNADCMEHGSESLFRSLKSLIKLDTLSISAKEFHPSLWKALHGLNIKCLNINGLDADCTEHGLESLFQSLKSLVQLDTLSIRAKEFHPTLWKALHGLNIKCLNIKCLNINGLNAACMEEGSESLFQSLKSLVQLDTLTISAKEFHPTLWKALHGLNIKCLNIKCLNINGLDADCMEHGLESLFQSLKSLVQLDTLSISAKKFHPTLWKALYGLNIKCLNIKCLNINGLNAACMEEGSESLFLSLKSLVQLDTLTISAKEFHPTLWKALHGLNIKCLNIKCLNINGLDADCMEHGLESLFQSLKSLVQLDTLSIRAKEFHPTLWKALHGLNIKCLNIKCRNINGLNAACMEEGSESLFQSLKSLVQLDTLTISAKEFHPTLWKALYGLNIKCLNIKCRNINGLNAACMEEGSESLFQSLKSLVQLDTLTISAKEFHPTLWKALHGLNIKHLNIKCLNINRLNAAYMGQGSRLKVEESVKSVHQNCKSQSKW